MSFQLGKRPLGLHHPDKDDAVLAARDHGRSVRRNRDRLDGPLVPFELTRFLFLIEIPEANLSLGPRDQQRIARRRERDRIGPRFIDLLDQLPRLGIPDAHRIVAAARHEHCAIRGVRQAQDAIAVPKLGGADAKKAALRQAVVGDRLRLQRPRDK